MSVSTGASRPWGAVRAAWRMRRRYRQAGRLVKAEIDPQLTEEPLF